MSIYIDQIEQLVVLQKVDSEMIGLERVLEEAPRQLRELQEKQSYLLQQQDVIRKKISVLYSDRKSVV